MARRLFCLGLLALGLLGRLSAADPEVRPLAGTWLYEAAGSSELSGWQSLQLVINVDGPRVTILWQYGAGRRMHDELIALDLSKSVNVVTSDFWASNRHIGAYMGADKTVKYKFRVLNDGRLLRTYADFTLATQQGEQAVNVVRQYKVSVDGSRLTLTEMCNTRDDPIIYFFRRVDEAGGTAANK